MSQRRPLVYVASKISDPDPEVQARNVEAGIAAAELLESRGFPVYCPHRELRQFAEQGAPYLWLMRQCFKALRERADVALFLPGWWDSRGATYEHAFVESLNSLREKKIERYHSIEALLHIYQ